MRIALLASYTIDQLQPFLEEELSRQGFKADVHVGHFNSVSQELLNPQSVTLAAKPDIVIVSQQLEDVSPLLTSGFSRLTESEIQNETASLVENVKVLLTQLRKHFNGVILIHNFLRPMKPAMGLFENMGPTSQIDAVRQLNSQLTRTVRMFPSAYVLDSDRVASEVGYRAWFDDRLWYLAHSPYSADALQALAKAQVALISALHRPRRKALVLDLDNTLWGGVLGEDGIKGIKLGQAYPGKIFREFQQTLLQLHNRGVMLAINSKNNPDDVEDVFRSHPEMLLKKEHFAAIKANWDDKAANMKKIAADLNIGLDALAFFDDSPLERERMRGALPEVLTIEVPGGPETHASALLECHAFDKLTFIEEDQKRGSLVKNETARREAESTAVSMEDFFRSLNMEVKIAELDDFTFPRAHDLLQKTNQFNLTTRRYSEQELTKLRNDPAVNIFTLRVQDKFGDLGIVGLAILKRTGEKALIDSLLMSCRVIGRTIETAFLRSLLDWAKKNKIRIVEGEFVSTAKNSPAKDFFSNHHFRKAGRAGAWSLSLEKIPFERPAYFRGS